jgi:hypothetical protein
MIGKIFGWVRLFCTQLGDPGKLVQIGYSAGSRDAAAFYGVKNLLSTRHDVEDKNVKGGSVCAFFWNMMFPMKCWMILINAFMHKRTYPGWMRNQ